MKLCKRVYWLQCALTEALLLPTCQSYLKNKNSKHKSGGGEGREEAGRKETRAVGRVLVSVKKWENKPNNNNKTTSTHNSASCPSAVKAKNFIRLYCKGQGRNKICSYFLTLSVLWLGSSLHNAGITYYFHKTLYISCIYDNTISWDHKYNLLSSSHFEVPT